MKIGLMIEGQDGLTWLRWQRLVSAAEELGYDSVFRSDHFTNARPPDKEALALWPSLTWAADHTERIQFGSLVTPVTFRLPAVTAEAAAAVSDLGEGRLVLGIGAGWQEREHRAFGIPFPPPATRFGMLQDYLEVVTLLLRSTEPVSYRGEYFSLDDAVLLPHPLFGGPAILVGGNGPTRTLPLAARYADEWNAVYAAPDEFGDLTQRLDSLLADAGRPPESVRRSAMLGTLLAPTQPELEDRLAQRGRTVEEMTSGGVVTGTPDMWVQQLKTYEKMGAARVMLQWLNQDDLAGIDLVAREVLPAFA